MAAPAVDAAPGPERDLVPARPAGQGPRLQLAQRHRLLVVGAALPDRPQRRGPVLSLGGRPALPPGWRGAPGAPGRSPQDGKRGRAGAAGRSRRALGRGRAADAGLAEPHPAPAGLARGSRDLLDPAGRPGTARPARPAHPGPRQRRDREVGALCQPEPRPAAALVAALGAYGGSGRHRRPDPCRPRVGRRGRAGVDRHRSGLAPLLRRRAQEKNLFPAGTSGRFHSRRKPGGAVVKTRDKSHRKGSHHKRSGKPPRWLVLGALASTAMTGRPALSVQEPEGRERFAYRELSAPALPASRLDPRLDLNSLAAAPRPNATARRFDIPPGSLGKALAAFEQATGVRVEVADESIRGLGTAGVQGLFSAEKALDELLAGT